MTPETTKPVHRGRPLDPNEPSRRHGRSTTPTTIDDADDHASQCTGVASTPQFSEPEARSLDDADDHASQCTGVAR